MPENLDPNEIRNTNEAITDLGYAATDAAKSLGKLSDSEATATKKATDSVDKLATEFDGLTRDIKVNSDLQSKQNILFERELKNLGYKQDADGKLIKTSVELSSGQKDQIDKIKVANSSFDNLVKQYGHGGSITEALNSKMMDLTKGSHGATASMMLVGGAASGMIKAFSSMTSSIYEGERGTKVGAKAAKEFTDSLSSAAKGIGIAMLLIPGYGIGIKIAGAALALFGELVGKAGEALKLSAEQNDTLVDSFSELSKAGLAGANGVTGVFDQIQTLGMTVKETDKYLRLMKDSSKDLKMFGATAALGAEQFAKVAGEMYKSDLGKKLEMIGVKAEEQREHTIKYMALQTKMGQSEEKDKAKLARGSSEYIKELDRLAELTGTTRKETEDARNAMLAQENLRVAIYQAQRDGDTKRAAELELALKVTSEVSKFDPRGAEGLAKLFAAGGPIDETSSAAMQTYKGLIDSVKAGKGVSDALVAGSKDITGQIDKYGDAIKYGGDLSGVITGKLSPMLDQVARTKKTQEEADKKGISVEELLKQSQEEKGKGDQRLKDSIEAARTQQAAAQMMESVVFTTNAAAALNKKASELFSEAVTKFNETVGARPVTGGMIDANANANAKRTAPDVVPKGPGPVSGAAVNAQRAAAGLSELSVESAEAQAAIATAAQRGGFRRRGTPPGTAPAAPAAAPDAASTGSRTSTGVIRPAAPAETSQGPISSADQLKAAGLTIKKGDVQKEGAYIDPKLIEAAKQVQASVPGFMQFTGFNDKYHIENSPTSKHTEGMAFDFVLNKKPSKEEGQKILSMLSDLGLEVYDEYASPSKKATGAGHFHGGLKAYDGGIFNGPIDGYNVELHGREAIVPLPSPNELVKEGTKESALPGSAAANTENSNGIIAAANTENSNGIIAALMAMMEEKFDDMIDVLQEGNDTSEELLKVARV